MYAIIELEKLGYRFSIDDDNLQAQCAGTARPSAAKVARHLAAIKANKAQALAFVAGRQRDGVPLVHGATYTIRGTGSVWLAMLVGGEWILKDVNKSFVVADIRPPYEVVNCLTVAADERLLAGEYCQSGGQVRWQIKPELTGWTVANLCRCRILTETIDLRNWSPAAAKQQKMV